MIGVQMHEEMQDLIKNPAEQNDHPSLVRYNPFLRRTRAEGEEMKEYQSG